MFELFCSQQWHLSRRRLLVGQTFWGAIYLKTLLKTSIPSLVFQVCPVFCLTPCSCPLSEKDSIERHLTYLRWSATGTPSSLFTQTLPSLRISCQSFSSCHPNSYCLQLNSFLKVLASWLQLLFCTGPELISWFLVGQKFHMPKRWQPHVSQFSHHPLAGHGDARREETEYSLCQKSW